MVWDVFLVGVRCDAGCLLGWTPFSLVSTIDAHKLMQSEVVRRVKREVNPRGMVVGARS